ncbi:fatty acid desaturase [Acuticoccus sp. M5D2P5]|uniref:fatty acid desaturase n=1 Tax=Acuticoccus kalidii TaxID=2910977 RepID=UPI001F1CE2BD|nr:fatty acid desaturase [Acuticoccus kalidii]MCF3936051.1 fatty acid desaturase [Acuticoccus kalidii]
MSDAMLAERRKSRLAQTAIGVGLACLVVAAWLTIHIVAIFGIDWGATSWWLALPLILIEMWLFVGLFIIAHDCMHGSLAPGRPAINRAFGRVALFLYAAFSYDRLLPEHHKHHRRPGTADDPDFDADHPSAFWPWFARFMLHYYGWREAVSMTAAMAVYVLLLGPPIGPLLVFYALPAILSAVQLFYFGTYRPHRVEEAAFTDDHRTRTDDFPWLLSLITCFHFGYHHEHHLSPTVPWWRLPTARRTRRHAPPALAGAPR